MHPVIKMIKQTGWVRLVSLAGLLMVGGLILLQFRSVSGTPAAAPTPVSQNGDEGLVHNLQAALQNDQLSASERASLQRKLALAERAAARPTVQAGQSLPSRLLPTVAVPTSPAQMAPGLLTGSEEKIIAGSEGLVRPSEASVENLWIGQRNNIDYQVLAGAAAEDAAQGWVMVFETHAPRQLPPQVYLAPGKTGSLHILSVKGTQVLLASASGKQVSFDLASHTFLP